MPGTKAPPHSEPSFIVTIESTGLPASRAGLKRSGEGFEIERFHAMLSASPGLVVTVRASVGEEVEWESPPIEVTPCVGVTPFMEATATTDSDAEFSPKHEVVVLAEELFYGLKAGVEVSGGMKVNGWLASLLGSETHYKAAGTSLEKSF